MKSTTRLTKQQAEEQKRKYLIAVAERFLKSLSISRSKDSLSNDSSNNDAIVGKPPKPVKNAWRIRLLLQEGLFKKNVALNNGLPCLFATVHGSPILIASFCVDYEGTSRKRTIKKESVLIGDASYRNKVHTQSYAHLVSNAFLFTQEKIDEDHFKYSADFLDDPELRTGRHSTVIALPCLLVLEMSNCNFLLTSCILYSFWFAVGLCRALRKQEGPENRAE